MSQNRQGINSHVEKYLDYYCGLSDPPEFAVLLKGQWGCGKTWFIDKYCEKSKEKNHKYLYVSLYGMTSFSEIEYTFFQKLHPRLSSKGMVIAGKILKGFLKGTLKIDLNDDQKSDGTLNIQIPDINLPEYLKNADERILIFDDLERCKIDLSNLLGYINSFVEHQGLKVILIANEDKLLEDANYKSIKEKLIGKTFAVSTDFEGVLNDSIDKVKNLHAKSFLSDNTNLIQLLYQKAEYKNLRSLKLIVLDFEIILNELPEKVKNNLEILRKILELLISFSIEIKRGTILPRDINNISNQYIKHLSTVRQNRIQPDSSITENNNKDLTSLQILFDRYPFVDFYEPFPDFYDLFPNEKWWQIFFDESRVDTEILKESISSSKHFQDKIIPNWVKLFNYAKLSDDEFSSLIDEVKIEYSNRAYDEIGIIKHLHGLFLHFFEIGLYDKSKEEIFENSKRYIDDLKEVGRLSPAHSSCEDSYKNLIFQGQEFKEFKQLSLYIKQVQELIQQEKIPKIAQDLLGTIQEKSYKFYRAICEDIADISQDENALIPKYYDVPILKYMEPDIFVETLLSIKEEDQRCIFSALKQRYKSDNINTKITEELEWLKCIQSLLQIEVDKRKGKLSGYKLDILVKEYLNEAIKKLEPKQSQT